MKIKLMLGVVLLAFLCGVSYAQEDQIKQLAMLGPGVHKIKKNESSGALLSCVVVGQARISTVLGLSEGLIDARRNAKQNAEAEFVKWVKTNVKVVETNGKERILKLEGTGDQRNETGKSIQTDTVSISSAAQGAVRGLQVVGYDQQEGTGESMLTVVLGWSPANAVMAGQAGAVNAAEYQTPVPSSGGDVTSPGGAKPASGVPTTPIPAKTVVSEDAAGFL